MSEFESVVPLALAVKRLRKAGRKKSELWEQPYKAAEGVVVEPSDLRAILKALDAFNWVAGLYDGEELTREHVAAELSDFRMICGEVPKVYDHITGGLISKANTCAKAVIAVFDDRVTEMIDEAVAGVWDAEAI